MGKHFKPGKRWGKRWGLAILLSGKNRYRHIHENQAIYTIYDALNIYAVHAFSAVSCVLFVYMPYTGKNQIYQIHSRSWMCLKAVYGLASQRAAISL